MTPTEPPPPETIAVEMPCRTCGETFATQQLNILGHKFHFRYLCPPCDAAKIASDQERQANEKEAELRTAWEAICPPIYRDTDLARIDARCAQTALDWNASGSVGVGILGTTGAGKTRALYHAMQRAHRLGRSCAAISHNAFSRAVGIAFSGDGADRAEARHRLEQLRRAQVVLIDDLGKAPSTERTDAELEDLVEERTANRRPILWTSNGSAGWLAKRLGNDRGEPFVRRLSEFSTIVSL
jgi:DNA replication protein DnaC